MQGLNTFNCASADCVPEEELFAVESPQWVWPTGPVEVNILAAANVCLDVEISKAISISQ